MIYIDLYSYTETYHDIKTRQKSHKDIWVGQETVQLAQFYLQPYVISQSHVFLFFCREVTSLSLLQRDPLTGSSIPPADCKTLTFPVLRFTCV